MTKHSQPQNTNEYREVCNFSLDNKLFRLDVYLNFPNLFYHHILLQKNPLCQRPLKNMSSPPSIQLEIFKNTHQLHGTLVTHKL